MNPEVIAKRLLDFLVWIITSPIAFLLWFSAAVIAVGLGLGYINAVFSTRLPTFGVQPQSAIYAAGVIYLLHGKV